MHTKQDNKRTTHWLIILGLIAMLLGCPLAFAASQEPQVIAEGMNCAACGMYPHRYPQWADPGDLHRRNHGRL